MKQLSIIIPTWNTAQITLKCVNTIRQHLPKDYYEIIVVDNGSTDDTQKIFGQLKTIKYIRLDSNTGFSHANNIGINKSSGKYLLFLNSDMELVDSQLVKMVDYLDTHPQVGIIGPRFLNPDLTPQASVFPPQTPINAIKEYWLGIKNSYVKHTPNSNTPTNVWAVSGGAVLISRQNIKKLGGWSEKYFFYFEDLELCRQIRQQNLQVYYYPHCQVIHRHGASGTTLADSANQWRRLIPSSKIYHGLPEHYLLFFITWSRRQWQKLTGF